MADFKKSRIIGTGGYLPEQIVTNFDLEKIVDTTDEWIFQRSGIKQRHKIADNQVTSDLGVEASKKAIEMAGISVSEIDMIICATTTSDLIFPSTASVIQRKLGITHHCPAFDVQAVCAGFMFAMSIADKYIRLGEAKTILVIGAEALTRLLDYKDRTTCVLFGDGAGAMVVRADEHPRKGILSTVLHTNGALAEILKCGGGVGTHNLPFGYLQMNGKEVFKTAVTYLSQVMQETLNKAGYNAEELDFIVPHQANMRIMQATAEKIGAGTEKLICTIEKHGNTSAASIPLAFDEAMRQRRFKEDNLILMEAIGGGMSWGGCLVRL